MDRGRRAEPYSNATIWTREIAKNLAGHLSRVSKAHSCVDTKSPKSTRLPQFHHSYAQKRCPTSPMKTHQPLLMLPRNSSSTGEPELDFRGISGSSAREETDGALELIDNVCNSPFRHGVRKHDLTTRKTGGTPSQPQNDDTNSGVEANQEIQDRLMRIPAVKAPAKEHHYGTGNALNDMAYDCPPILPHQRNRLAHDYYKRQEQKKIWQENQALIKRLQSTKATLNSKEWKKDGKWTQEFLKNQERRRSALQQELRRAQVSPHALLRSKPLKTLNPHNLKSAHHESHSDKILDVTCSPINAGVHSARKLFRRGSKEQVLAESREAYAGTILPGSAANHRRILELRKQKPSLSSSDDIPDVIFTESTTIYATDTALGDNQGTFIPDNDIVNVRFTFSRGRSRGNEMRTHDIDQTDQPQSLETDESERGTMSLSGAFSPGIELESALNAVAVDETEFINQPSPDQLSHAVDSEADEVIMEAYRSQQSELDPHADGTQENIFGSPDVTAVEDAVETVLPSSDTTEDNDSNTNEPDKTTPEDAAFAVDISQGNRQELPTLADCERQKAEKEKRDVEATDTAINTGERNSPSVVEQEHTEPNDGDEEEESYDADNFDDDPASPDMGSHGTLPVQIEDTSGYGSEFEEEAAVLAIPFTEIPTGNQNEDEHDEEDASYSNDDFVE